jgi:pimeloyl-ACP methyl ester carboxylesterase
MAPDRYCSQVTWSGTKKERMEAMKWNGSRQRIPFGMLDVNSPPSLWWIAVSIMGLALVLSITSVQAQSATPQAATAVSASGDFDGLVDIGNGRRIYLTCRGSGSPTVLLEAGSGNNAQIWDQIALPPDSDKEAVFPAVAGFTRVCAYDRPGTLLDETHLSRSDPVTGRRTAEDMVADVHALVEAAGLERPLVLAAHSFGGLIVRLYALTYPDDVAGLVLVDSAHESGYATIESLLTPAQFAAAFPPEGEDEPGVESLDVFTSADQVAAAQAASPLRDMPVIVLTHGGPFPYPEDYPVEALEALWTSAQKQLAALVPGTRWIVASESGHYIQLSEPDLVISAIRDVVDAVRDPDRWSTPVASPSAQQIDDAAGFA